MGGLGGLAAYGLHFGTSYTPVGGVGQALILTAAGTLVSVGVAALADERAAAGIMGGTTALVAGRIHAQMQLGDFAKKAKEGAATNGTNGSTQASSVMGRYMNAGAPIASFTGRLRPQTAMPGMAGKVVPRGAGAMVAPGGGIAPAAQTSMAPLGMARNQSFRVPVGSMGAGAVHGARLMGPRSWAYNTSAGRVYVSAHDVPRR